jgi:hypothetical protein
MELTGIAGKLDARSSQVSFKDLYTAVLALQATEGDHCPACDTPLADVIANPFNKAKTGLAQLKELGELQVELKNAQRKVATLSRELRQQLGNLATFVVAHGEQETPVGRYLAGLTAEPTGDWWTAVYPALTPQEGGASAAVTLEQILGVTDRIAAQDAASLLARQERQRNITERDGRLPTVYPSPGFEAPATG